MTEEDLLKLSAYADGEATDSERREVEASLAVNPKMREMLEAFRALHAAAQNEKVPQTSFDTESLWPHIAERAAPVSGHVSQRLAQCAADEISPDVSLERFQNAWKEITVHTTANREMPPSVKPARWHGVWKHISTRTTRPVVETGIQAGRAAGPSVQRANFGRTGGASYHGGWMWAAGVGLAATLIIAAFPRSVVRESAPRANKEVASDSTTSKSLHIPESQDENYGVKVRFVPGQVDPVVTLYLKTPGGVKALGGADVADPRD